MSSSSPMLQKKLTELETELADVYSHELEVGDPRHQISFDDVKQRFSFLGKLLAAEIESQTEASDELKEINQKFTQLEADFDKWNESKTKSCIFDNPIEICHDCTQAMILHHGESAIESDFSGEQSMDMVSIERGKRKERRRRRRRGKWKAFELLKNKKKGKKEGRNKGQYWEAFGCGVIIGALIILLVVELSSSSTAAFVLPPT